MIFRRQNYFFKIFKVPPKLKKLIFVFFMGRVFDLFSMYKTKRHQHRPISYKCKGNDHEVEFHEIKIGGRMIWRT